MSRAARLLALMQLLHRRRTPVTAEMLAAELAVSVRTVYRDVATLKAEGAPIAGEAGLGYVLETGFFLPPLTLRDDEIDAVTLGLRLVMARGDPDLAVAAQDALGKIAAVLPDVAQAPTSALLAGPSAAAPHLAALRRAMRAEHRLRLDYRDGNGCESRRVVWPVAVGFFDRVAVLVAWCEARGAFRHFRLDRIVTAEPTGERLPKRRRMLLADWQREEKLRERS